MTASKSHKKISGWTGLIAIVVIWSIFFSGRLSGRILINHVVGSGMSPTLNTGDFIVTSQDKKFERFDLVTYNPTPQQNVLVEKIGMPSSEIRIGRVLGTPTEVVEIVENVVYVNGSKISSLSVKHEKERTFSKEQVPIDKYFIIMDGNLLGLGDRAIESGADSRFMGFIGLEQMRKVVKTYKASQLPWNAVSEGLSGLSILLFLLIAPYYIRKKTSKKLLLTVFVVISYLFLGIMFAALAFSGVENGYVRLLLAFHYYYTEGVARIFGDNVFSVFLKEFGAFIGGGLSALALYELFLKRQGNAQS
jgi:signal peptidase I